MAEDGGHLGAEGEVLAGQVRKGDVEAVSGRRAEVGEDYSGTEGVEV